MIVAVHTSEGVYYTEAESLAVVNAAIANEEELTRFWYDTVTGERWEEVCILTEQVKIIRQEANDPA